MSGYGIGTHVSCKSTVLFFPGLYHNPRVARNTYILIFPGYTAYSTVLPLHTHASWRYTFWKRPDARFRSANWSRAAPRSTLEKKSRRAVKSEVGLHGRAPGDLSHLYQTRLTTISYCGTVVVFPGLSTAPHRTCSRAACLPASSPPEATFLLLLLLLLVYCRAPAPVALDGCPAAARVVRFSESDVGTTRWTRLSDADDDASSWGAVRFAAVFNGFRGGGMVVTVSRRDGSRRSCDCRDARHHKGLDPTR